MNEESVSEKYTSCEENEETSQKYLLRDRSKLRKPTAFEDYELSCMTVIEEDEPQTYRQAVSSKE